MSATPAVLVTGAGRGIGRATAVRLARHGWHVHAGVRSDAAAASLRAESDAITPVELDVTVPEHVEALVDAIPERLDALVNNVGIAVPGPVETLDRAAMHRQLDVNLVGPLAVTRAVLPHLRRAQGRIVFLSSVNGLVSFPFTGLYNASKFAVEAVADCLRVELGPFGVQVALIEPGVVDTDPWHEMDAVVDAVEAALPAELRDLYAGHLAGERQLVERIRRGAIPPETVARAVERALTRRRARARSVVGRDARLMLVMRAVLPARRMDALWTRELGLGPGRAPRAAEAPQERTEVVM
ncbi:SDR family oxidoreductase [Cellulomonas dongxiuzhuiae]|uniref:SDR family oxidoreductase n=1 Tax=Cellulomonas dongxiuzhuiae TaxID=2819979 RepID=UPI001AAFEA09|nr:SDR family oxidoreductase [Cellulomonas dongxiuzhuiae]MBO3088853.1 SDR family oxidoreductase [Cellulomonas dongxiuzhuiae]